MFWLHNCQPALRLSLFLIVVSVGIVFKVKYLHGQDLKTTKRLVNKKIKNSFSLVLTSKLIKDPKASVIDIE